MGTMRLSFASFICLIFLCTSAQAQSTTLAIRGTWVVDEILAGTDAGDDAYMFAASGLHDELALLVEAGLTPLEALQQAATLNPARFLELSNDLGTVTAGKLADLVLLEANPLEDIGNVRRIRTVIADGGLYRAADLERLIADVERAVATAIPGASTNPLHYTACTANRSLTMLDRYSGGR